MGRTNTYQRPYPLNFRKEVRWQQISSKEVKLLGEYLHNPAGVSWIYLHSRCILLHLSTLLDSSTLPNCQAAFCHCPPTTTAASVHGPPGGRSIADHSPRWPVRGCHHVPCAPTSSSYPGRSLMPCIAKQWKNTLSFLQWRGLKLERHGSRSKGYKQPLD